MELKDKILDLEKTVHKLFKWNVPFALPMEMFGAKDGEMTWESWQQNMKNDYPIKHFFMEQIPTKLYRWAGKVDNLFYYIRCNTYNKYHFLDLRQPKEGYYKYRWGWLDVNQKILFANFNLLVEFVEKERGGYEAAEKCIAELKTLEDVPTHQIECMEKELELYTWWKYELPKMHKEHDKLLHESCHGRKFNNCDNEKMRQSWEMQEKIDNTIDEKLKELIDIRMTLWT
jgi:hypothetical protein